MGVEGAVVPGALCLWLPLGSKMQPRPPLSRRVAQTCLCVLCPRREPVCHHHLIKPATLSPETPQSSLVTTCGTLQ